MQALSDHLLHSVAGARCGVVLPAHALLDEPCDDIGPLFDGLRVHNAATPADPANPWQTASGAVALDARGAASGAIAEALERIAAAQATFEVRPRHAIPADARLDDAAFALFTDAQRVAPAFPWPMPQTGDDLLAEVHALSDNRAVWVPQELVGLGPRRGEARMPSTSSGLAAWRDARGGPWLAVLRAAQELLERDALAATWSNGLGGRTVELPADWQAFVAARGGTLTAFELTQCWNPHPVIAVAGSLPFEGRPRPVMGIACRARRGEALHKALLEWVQALTFAAYLVGNRGDTLPRTPMALRRFDEHAAFYTLRPELWAQTALHAHAAPSGLRIDAGDVHARSTQAGEAAAQLQTLNVSLGHADVALFYRELTTRDVAAAGLRVMRVLSPQLTGLHADERAPFLGGRCADVEWRYPGAVSHGAWPNPLPHPLG